MRIEPDYIKFKNRIFLQTRESSVFLLFIAVIAEIIYRISIWKLLIVLFVIYLIFFMQVFLYNKYCLKFIEVKADEVDKNVKICIYKYDKYYSEQEIPMKDIKVKMYRILYSLLPWYKLKMYNKDKELISQVATKMWKLKDLKKIRDVVNEKITK